MIEWNASIFQKKLISKVFDHDRSHLSITHRIEFCRTVINHFHLDKVRFEIWNRFDFLFFLFFLTGCSKGIVTLERKKNTGSSVFVIFHMLYERLSGKETHSLHYSEMMKAFSMEHKLKFTPCNNSSCSPMNSSQSVSVCVFFLSFNVFTCLKFVLRQKAMDIENSEHIQFWLMFFTSRFLLCFYCCTFFFSVFFFFSLFTAQITHLRKKRMCYIFVLDSILFSKTIITFHLLLLCFFFLSLSLSDVQFALKINKIQATEWKQKKKQTKMRKTSVTRFPVHFHYDAYISDILVEINTAWFDFCLSNFQGPTYLYAVFLHLFRTTNSIWYIYIFSMTNNDV